MVATASSCSARSLATARSRRRVRVWRSRRWLRRRVAAACSRDCARIRIVWGERSGEVRREGGAERREPWGEGETDTGRETAGVAQVGVGADGQGRRDDGEREGGRGVRGRRTARRAAHLASTAFRSPSTRARASPRQRSVAASACERGRRRGKEGRGEEKARMDREGGYLKTDLGREAL